MNSLVITALVGAHIIIAISTFAMMNPMLVGIKSGHDLSPIVVYDQHNILDEQLKFVQDAVGTDFEGYRNHCLRTLTFVYHQMPDSVFDKQPNILDIVSVALAFHNVGMWTLEPRDYKNHSIAVMEQHVKKEGKWDNTSINMMREIILLHDLFGQYKDGESEWMNEMINTVRHAYWADTTVGFIRGEMHASIVEAAYKKVPDAGYHNVITSMTSRFSLYGIILHLVALSPSLTTRNVKR